MEQNVLDPGNSKHKIVSTCDVTRIEALTFALSRDIEPLMLSFLQMRVFDAKNNAEVSKWLRYLYLRTKVIDIKSRIQWYEQHNALLETLPNSDTPRKEEKDAWTAIIEEDPSWKDVSDAAYVAWQYYRLLYRSHVKRKPQRVGQFQIPMPTPASTDEIAADVQSHAIGQWSEADPVEADPPLNEKLMDKFDKGDFPIGNITKTTISATTKKRQRLATNRSFISRFISPALVFAYLLSLALQSGILSFDPSQTNEVHLDVACWGDGVTWLGLPTIVVLGFFVWNPAYTRTTLKQWTDQLRMYPLALVVKEETIQSVSAVMNSVAARISQIPPLIFRGIKYFFCFKLLNGDNPFIEKSIGNSCGGYYKCILCDADFSKPQLLWNFKYLISRRKKDLVSILKYWLNGEHSVIGLVRIPPLLGQTLDDLKHIDLEQPEWQWVKSFLVGLDPLHNCKGHLCTLLALVRIQPYWDDVVFVTKLVDVVGRKDVSELDGAHVRYLFVKYRETLLPALHLLKEQNTAAYQSIERMLKDWSEVCSYTFLLALFSFFVYSYRSSM